MAKLAKILPFFMVSFYVAFNLISLTKMSATYDERAHLQYGVNILHLNSNQGSNNDAPSSAINAIPSVLSGQFRQLGMLGFAKFLESLVAARCVTVLVSVFLVIIVYKWSKVFYGSSAALLALFLCLFEPNLNAHSQLVTTDVYAALMATAVMYLLWKYLETNETKDLMLGAIAFGLSQITKYTLLFLIPIIIFVLIGRGLYYFFPKNSNRELQNRFLAQCFKVIMLYSFFMVISINIGFLFNNSFCKLSDYHFKLQEFRNIQKYFENMTWVRVPFPHPYLDGLDGDVLHLKVGNIYLLGVLQDKRPFHGFYGYYLWAFIFKVPLPIQLIIYFSVFLYIKSFNMNSFFRKEWFLFIPVLVYSFCFNLFVKTPVGIRHYLFVFPFLLIFCSQFARSVVKAGKVMKIFFVCLLVYLTASVPYRHPFYLAYFNDLVWDRKMAYKILVDSNLDWGQSKFYIWDYLREHPNTVYNPSKPIAGDILVDVNYLVGVFGPERYRWLRENFKPVGHVAYSVLLFRVTKEDLAKIKQGNKPASIRFDEVPKRR